MKVTNTLRFILTDLVDNQEVKPRHIPLSLLGDFQEDVSKFLSGSTQDVNPEEIFVSIEEGSFALVVSGLLTATTLWADLEHLKTPNSLSLIDKKRAFVVEGWQKKARNYPNRTYQVTNPESQVNMVVNAYSDFHKSDTPWVSVEKYLYGKVVNWGGKTKPNIHLEISNGIPRTIIIAASREKLLKEQSNLLYREVQLRVSVEENLCNGELRNFELLELESHAPSYDQDEFDKMVKAGTEAWSDITDITVWMENLRGTN